MKRLIAVVAVVASVFLLAAAPADARVLVGTRVYIGPGWGPYWGPYWYPPYYYPPAVVYPGPIVTEPQSFIQQQAPMEAMPAAPAPSYWYFCESAKAYYPYVQECPGGWLQVVPPPAPESPR